MSDLTEKLAKQFLESMETKLVLGVELPEMPDRWRWLPDIFGLHYKIRIHMYRKKWAEDFYDKFTRNEGETVRIRRPVSYAKVSEH